MSKNLKQCGLVGYGAYIPSGRIRVFDIAAVWGKEKQGVNESLGVFEKTVPAFDEDAVTMAVEAGRRAIVRADILPQQIEAIYVGSESRPYAVNPSSTTVGEVLGMGSLYMASDLEFACKAGTAGMQVLAGFIEAERISYGLVIGTDCGQAKPGDVLEYTAGAGAAAFILCPESKKILARIIDFISFSSDTPDFWRRDGIAFPSHGGRFTGEPGYFTHIIGAGLELLKRSKSKPSDFDYCVFHMPNGKFPRRVAARLGFSLAQLEPSLIVSEVGNPYSASSLLGLAAVLDIAKPKEKIFLVSYGSGAGADAFIFETTRFLVEKRKKGKTVSELIKNKTVLSYPEYLKRTGRI